MEMANGLSRAREAGPVDRDAWGEAVEELRPFEPSDFVNALFEPAA